MVYLHIMKNQGMGIVIVRRWFVIVALLAVVFHLAAPASAKEKKKPAENKPTVVLLPIILHGETSKESVASFQDAAAESLQSRYSVQVGSKVEAVMKKVAQKESQKAECDLTACYAKIAVEFNSEYLAVVNVTKEEGDYSISLKIMNVVTNDLVLSRGETCPGCKVYQVVEKLRSLAGGEKVASAPPVEKPAESEQASKGANANDTELAFWNSVKDGANLDDFEAYLQDYPKGKFVSLAKRRIAALKKSAAQAQEPPAKKVDEVSANKERELWNSVKDGGNAEDLSAYLESYPKGAFAPLARSRMAALKKAVDEEASRKESAKKAEEKAHEGMVFVKKGGGGFYMDKYLVTQEAYERVTGQSPSDFKNCPACPVEHVNWDEATSYCSKVGKKLPSEQDWEYAATSGGKSETWAGTSTESELGDYAWYKKNSGDKTHPVGEKNPNGLGLYDMSGNVWEWTDSWWDSSQEYRVVRGGSWFNDAAYLRAALRYSGAPVLRNIRLGFRCAQY